MLNVWILEDKKFDSSLSIAMLNNCYIDGYSFVGATRD